MATDLGPTVRSHGACRLTSLTFHAAQYHDNYTLPNPELSLALDGLSAMNINDSAMPHRPDPTKISNDPALTHNYARPPRSTPNPQLNTASRQQSIAHDDLSEYPDAYAGTVSPDYGSPYPQEPASNRPISFDPKSPQFYSGSHAHSTWPAQHHSFYAGSVNSGISQPELDPLHAAASSVLGMGPPSSTPTSVSGQSFSRGSLAGSHYSSGSSHPPVNTYQHAPSSQPYPPMPPISSETSSISSRRPTLQRSGTTASVVLNTRKTKAIDLNAPPYTKEYIDQYRQRIKADPDPEAHFLYAKYLIEAAKKIGAEAQDQRAVKKYRDMLIVESLKVIRRLATQGQPYDEAQFFLANCYGTGMLGLQVDHERAYHLYLQAAKQNHPAASYRVAVCNEIGAGTKREPSRAAAFYRKASSLGDTPAMYKLGMILLNGSLGELRNPREAISWLKRAAEQADGENPHALHELALLYEIPNSQLVPYDPAYAKNLFTQAANLGYIPSQFKLGQCYEYGSLTCPVDPRRSIAWYTKAAEKGDPEAELALSGWYLTGSEGVLKQSDSEAYLWARRAANKGLSKAEYAVGYYAEVGIGLKQDMEFAKRWYMRAAGELMPF
jgi:TPR repeat protein